MFVDDVIAARPSLGRMIGRALLRRCPRCGSGRQFRHWIRRAPHCPGCGYAMEKRPDFFFGGYLLNLIVTFAALFGLLIAMVIFAAAEKPIPVGPAVVLGLLCSVVLPLAFYPFSFTLWAVVDLHSEPLLLGEIADAVETLEADDPAGEIIVGSSPK